MTSRTLPVLLFAAASLPAAAQARPFVFTVTTDAPSQRERWTVHSETAYADRTQGPFGYDGLEQRVGIQGSLGHGFTVLGQLGLGVAGESSTNSTQEGEILKDVFGPRHGLRLAGGVGLRREWEGSTVLSGRVALGHAFQRSSLFGNLRLEKPFADDRDSVDLITSLGWLHDAGHGLHVGLEAIGQDLEGFWEADEAEGGATLFVGPSLHLAPAGRRFYATLCGGPVVRATHNDRTSPAPRPVDPLSNGYAVRLAVGYAF